MSDKMREAAIAEAYKRFPDVTEPSDHPLGKIVADRGSIRYGFLEGVDFALAEATPSRPGTAAAAARREQMEVVLTEIEAYCTANGKEPTETVISFVRRLLATLTPQVLCAWQPIETAPRDGTDVLLWAEAWDMTWGIQIGHFREGEHCWATSEGTVDDNDENFDPDAEVFDESCDDINQGPTHWQPLPALPRADRAPE